uniref:response regulator n=1 Tax=Agathobacter sp. TaxID=2021311 RepID=UPI0040579DE9
MNINNARILVCDDSILARKQLKNIIFTMGEPTIFEASDGEKAIASYKENKPDLVFLDIIMPNKDGNMAIKEIMEYDPHAKIVVVSSVGTTAQLKSAIEAGVLDFIQKPLTDVHVTHILKKYLLGD